LPDHDGVLVLKEITAMATPVREPAIRDAPVRYRRRYGLAVAVGLSVLGWLAVAAALLLIV
jgi:hypothetical protein